MLLNEKVVLRTPSGELLQDFTYELNKSQVMCVLGPNGCGKSTFLKHIFTQHKKLNPTLKLSYLPQTHNKDFFVPHTLQEIAALGLSSRRLPAAFAAYLPESTAKRLWNVASGGERQRALLLQVLSRDSDVYLLDEPFNHLDEFSIQEFSTLLGILREEHEKSFVIATHVVPPTLETHILKNLKFSKSSLGVSAHV